MSYAKITYKGYGMKRARTMLVRIVSEGPRFVLCSRVNEEGEELDSWFEEPTAAHPKGRYVDQQHMIQKETIRKRIAYKMNNHYGMLEPE